MKWLNYFFVSVGVFGLLLLVFLGAQFATSSVNAYGDGQSGIGRVGLGIFIFQVIFVLFASLGAVYLLNKNVKRKEGLIAMKILLLDCVLGALFIFFYLVL